jgi:hypothetical protein
VQHKIRQELRLIQHKRAAARQSSSVLQKVLSSVQASQEREAKVEQHMGKQTRVVQEKQASYPADTRKYQQRLDRIGFTDEVRCCCFF